MGNFEICKALNWQKAGLFDKAVVRGNIKGEQHWKADNLLNKTSNINQTQETDHEETLN